MPFHRHSLLPLTVFAAGVSWAETIAQLEVEAAPASVLIRPVAEDREFVRLPSLEYQFAIDARCAENYFAESVSIGIADTRKTLLREELAIPGAIVIDVVVPARQVAPLPVDGFCSATPATSQNLLVQDVITASLSLRCSGDQGESIIYTTRPLAVALTCDAGDQGESESLILR